MPSTPRTSESVSESAGRWKPMSTSRFSEAVASASELAYFLRRMSGRSEAWG
jgi:hypothetical protein